MKLLIIEDEETLRKALQKGFVKLGYAVDTASDGEAALEQYYSAAYDAIILDLNLPKLDGLSVLGEIRKDSPDAKVLILSARNEIDDRIIGLDQGANDYLGKPFAFRELEARVRALIRRAFTQGETCISHGTLTLDTALKKVCDARGEIALTRKEYGILEYLLRNRGTIVSAAALIEHVWEGEGDAGYGSLRVHVGALRKKLPELSICNARGQGYYVE
ncbi:response regulator transcription factor [Eubacteriales bacterium OttesenSCG-928-A19]|nr:response regulator transcription factor [Eubacteriales bacterium OttesenSCG-928-A19]